MKKLLFSVLFILLAFTSKSQTWQPLGPDNRDELSFGFSRLLWVKHDADTMYAALVYSVSGSNLRKLIIKRFNGLKWDTVGAPLTTISTLITITMDRFHTPYVIEGNVVKKYINGAWNQIGNSPFTGVVNSASIKIANADTPYVVFVASGKISMMKYNGTAWDSVGNKQFANVSGAPILGFDTAGAPYVAFSDPVNLNRATVMKFSGGSWTVVSPFGGLSTLGAGSLNIQVDSSTNHLYLKYHDTALGPTVKKYDGNSWSSVGTIGLPNSFAEDMQINSLGVPYLSMRRSDSAWVIKFDGNNWIAVTNSVKNMLHYPTSLSLSRDTIPILGYHLPSYGGKPVVSTYTSFLWTKIGTYGFVPEGVPNYANVFAPFINRLLVTVNNNNVPYVVFSDNAYGGKLSLMKYSNGSWSYEGSPGFTASLANPLQFEKGKNDTLYVMYGQSTTSGYKLAYFDGNSFVNINSGLTNQTYPTGTALAMDTTGTPHVIYPDPSNFNITTLKQLINGNWNTVTSLPCTTTVQMKINKQNEVYALYNSIVNNNTVSNLVKYTNNNWASIVQSQLQGLMRIAPNDSVFLLTMKLYSYNSGGGQIPTPFYYYRKELNKLTLNNWNTVGIFYTTPSSSLTPPSISESYVNLIFDTSSIPYVAVVTQDSVSIKALSYSFVNAAPSFGWHKDIKTANFDMAFGPNNQLIAAYSQGTAYALGFQVNTSVPPPPQAISSFVYCQGDIATALNATGQNLRWYGPGAVVSTTPPIPSTAVADTFTWLVTQTFGIYESQPTTIDVIIHPKPVINASTSIICTGDTAYLSTTTIPGATYHWTHTQIVNGVPIVNSFDSTSTIAAVDSGAYTVTITTHGCTSAVTKITLIPVLPISITISAPSAIPQGQLVTVIATLTNAGSGYLIDWFLNGGLLVTTPFDTLNYTKAAGVDAIVAVVRTPQINPCFVTDTSNTQIIDVLTGTSEILTQAGIVVYPNPFSNSLTTKGLNYGDQLNVYSLEGKLIQTWNASGEKIQNFETKHIPAGTYVLKIVSRKATVNVPLIKL